LRNKEKRGIINEIIACEEGIAMASEVLITISKDEKERFRLLSEEKYMLDTQSNLSYARQEGQAKKALEIARKMKEIGRPLPEIAEVTGLPPETIERL
jgi:predicted transposase/invertase (TIGR01784 family)